MPVLRWLLSVTLAKFARISRPLQTDLGTACTEFPIVVNTSFYSEWIINQNKHRVQLRIKPRIHKSATLVEQVISTRKYTTFLKLAKLSSLSCLISTTTMTLMLTHGTLMSAKHPKGLRCLRPHDARLAYKACIGMEELQRPVVHQIPQAHSTHQHM